MTYHEVHERLREVRGVARRFICPCGKPAADWAYQHVSKDEKLSERGAPYSEDLGDYRAMCRGCHLRLDYAHGVVRGWAAKWGNPDPEFLKNNREAAIKNGVGARARLAELQEDPEAGPRIRSRQSAGGKSGGCAQKRRCLQCGVVMLAAPMGRHQKTSGHAGLGEAE